MDSQTHLLPFGPMAEPIIKDDFSYAQVKEKKCHASVCKKISYHLVENSPPETKYLPVCMPCYNEDVEELMKSFLSLLENVDFMLRKTRVHNDKMGKSLKQEYLSTIPIIVPIFDGVKALSPSIRSWLESNFPGILEGMDGPSDHGLVDVRIASSRWWYYCNDTLPGAQETDGTAEGGTETGLGVCSGVAVDDLTSNLLHEGHYIVPRGSDRRNGVYQSVGNGQFTTLGSSNIVHFHIIPIVKRSNHRKHNSHEWFFNSICQGLESKIRVAFLTDCGTTFKVTCLARLYHELYFHKDLIGVTARQRVETPNKWFHPCEDSPWDLLRGDHSEPHLRKPCWRCYVCYLCSPCPLQGFEFEATLIMNSSMFNLVEALPVMPGPCQLLNWQKMKKYKVVDEYFNFLFNGESEKTVPELPSRFQIMNTGGISLSGYRDDNGEPDLDLEAGESEVSSDEEEDEEENSEDGTSSQPHTALSAVMSAPVEGKEGNDEDVEDSHVSLSVASSVSVSHSSVDCSTESEGVQMTTIGTSTDHIIAARHHKTTGVAGGNKRDTITFTEFLRANLRLAEDRILSFVCVFSTGYGTKWIPGATFYYRPESLWQTLLTQRRRWLNGTFASFLFFFNSKRAKTRIRSGMYDSHKAGKNIRLVNALWSLQLFQLLLVLITPAIFGSATYIGVRDCAVLYPPLFGWAAKEVVGSVTFADLWVVFYFLLYSSWTLHSYSAPSGKMSEAVCRLLAVVSFLFIFPIYFALVRDTYVTGLNFVSALVMVNVFLPVFIAVAQSVTSAVLYLCYLPWFLFLIVFFLVYIPSYSFARLWDTTWGNRAGAADSAISDKIQNVMKQRNLIFIYSLIGLNMFLSWVLIRVLKMGYSFIIAFMILVFSPTIVQLISSFLFLYVIVPFRSVIARPTENHHNDYHSSGSGVSSSRSSSSGSGSSSNNSSDGSVRGMVHMSQVHKVTYNKLDKQLQVGGVLTVPKVMSNASTLTEFGGWGEEKEEVSVGRPMMCDGYCNT